MDIQKFRLIEDGFENKYLKFLKSLGDDQLSGLLFCDAIYLNMDADDIEFMVLMWSYDSDRDMLKSFGKHVFLGTAADDIHMTEEIHDRLDSKCEKGILSSDDIREAAEVSYKILRGVNLENVGEKIKMYKFEDAECDTIYQFEHINMYDF